MLAPNHLLPGGIRLCSHPFFAQLVSPNSCTTVQNAALRTNCTSLSRKPLGGADEETEIAVVFSSGNHTGGDVWFKNEFPSSEHFGNELNHPLFSQILPHSTKS